MKFKSVAIFVKDIKKSKKFYIEILNQEIEHDFTKSIMFKNGLTLWEVQEEHEIRKLSTDDRVNRFELYFETEDIERDYKIILKSGAEFLHSIEEEWGQKTMRFFDLDNHLIEIGESLETFILNMNNIGLSVDEIVKKSGVKLDVVNKILKKTPYNNGYKQ